LADSIILMFQDLVLLLLAAVIILLVVKNQGIVIAYLHLGKQNQLLNNSLSKQH